MKKVSLLLFGVAIAAYSFGQLPTALTITKASKAVKVDGVVDTNDPWGSTWVANTNNKAGGTTSASTSKFQLTYDDDYLWLVAESDGDASVDTDAVAIPNTYERDCYEVFVKMDTNSWSKNEFPIASGKYIQGDYQFRNARGTVWPDRFEQGQGQADWKLPESNFKIGQVDQDSKFVQEWQMPWDSLLPYRQDSTGKGLDTVAFDGKFFKFDIQCADNTTGAAGGRSQQEFWRNNSDSQWNNTTTFSVVKLATAITPRPIKAAVKTASISDVYIKNNASVDKLRISKVGNYKVYDVTGKQVLDLRNTDYADASALKPGIYFVKSSNATMKFVKR